MISGACRRAMIGSFRSTVDLMEKIAEPELVDPRLRPGSVLLDEGRQLARLHQLGASRFMTEAGVTSEAEYKRRAMDTGRMMLHADLGFRSVRQTLAAVGEVYDTVDAAGGRVDRFGISLDWTMGYPPERRSALTPQNGLVLTSPEDFASLTAVSAAALHFGDFMLGFPGAVSNVSAAIEAGATSIGNLGQYFTFRLPDWDSDVATTEATVVALGLIAAQPVPVLVHSDLDDGLSGRFHDMACALGMAMVEKYLVEDLIGASLTFSYGRYQSDPLMRAALHAALATVSDTPGAMLLANRSAHSDDTAGRTAALANCLLSDLTSLGRRHSGHAISPAPMSGIPGSRVDAITEAHCFATRLADYAPAYLKLIDPAPIRVIADRLVDGGKRFAASVLEGLAQRGVDTRDPAEMLLALRRLGARRLEAMWGPGEGELDHRLPLVPAEWAAELDLLAESWASAAKARGAMVSLVSQSRRLRIVVTTTSANECGKYLIERAMTLLGIDIVDGGGCADAEDLVTHAKAMRADGLAVTADPHSAADFCQAVMAALNRRDMKIPLLVGGDMANSSSDAAGEQAVDINAIHRAGAIYCVNLDGLMLALERCVRTSHTDRSFDTPRSGSSMPAA